MSFWCLQIYQETNEKNLRITALASKGELISEWNFGVFKSSKKWTFFWQIFTLASKMGQIKKLKAIILDSK